MNLDSVSGASAAQRRGYHALSRCLSLDLEVGRNDGRIHALAGVRPDTDDSFTFTRRRGLPQGPARLDELAQGADFLLGHNLIDFDMPDTQAALPQRLGRLPLWQGSRTSSAIQNLMKSDTPR